MEASPATTAPGVRDLYQNGAPVNGTNEVQRITINGSPTGGTWTLSYTENGLTDTTTPLAHNANAAAIAAALNALPNIGPGGVTVSGTGPFDVTFVAGNVGGRNVPQLVAASAFTGGTSPAVVMSTTTPGVRGSWGGIAPRGGRLTNLDNGFTYVNTGTDWTPVWTQLNN